MAWLKFYEEEEKLFKESYAEKPGNKGLLIIHKKLCRHFKLGDITLYFNARTMGHAGWYHIVLPSAGGSVGLLCHELSHIYAKRKHPDKVKHRKHNKTLMRVIAMFNRYCKKKDYWREEIVERTAPKQPKSPPSKDEIRERKILRRKEQIKKHRRKIRFYTTLLRKAERSLAALERYQNAQKGP